MGVLEDTGQYVYVPRPQAPLPPIMGERSDVRGNVGLQPLEAAAVAPQIYFSYGQHFDSWDGHLPSPEQNRLVVLSDEQMMTFLDAVYWLVDPQVDPKRHTLWMRRALDSVQAMQRAIRYSGEAEVPIFRARYTEWAKDDRNLPAFVRGILKLLHAHDDDPQDPWHVVRDDFNDEGADPSDTHGTIIRVGGGPMSLFVIEESVVEEDEYGRRTLWRQLSVTQRFTTKSTLQLLNKFRLAEKMRVEYKLREGGADDAEVVAVLAQADRGNVQRDAQALTLLEQHRNPSPPGRMTTWLRLGRTMLDRVVEWSMVRWPPSDKPRTKARHAR